TVDAGYDKLEVFPFKFLNPHLFFLAQKYILILVPRLEGSGDNILVHSHVRSFRFFAFVPNAPVLDDLKSAVLKASFTDPDLNPLYARLSLRPLQDEDVGEFIRIRLKVAKAGPDLFTRDAIKLIELDSKGSRRVIMNLAGNCMDLAVSGRRR